VVVVAGGAASAQYRGPLGQTMRRIVRGKPQRSGGGLREKAVRAALARAEFGRTVPLCGTTDAAGQILAAARACTGQRRRGGVAKGTPGHSVWARADAGVPSLPRVLAENGLPEVAPLSKGERVMLDRKSWTRSNRELQTPFTPRGQHTNPQVKEPEEDFKSE